MKLRFGFKSILVFVALLAVAFFCFSCANDSGNGNPTEGGSTAGANGASVSGVSLNTTTLDLLVNGTATLSATVTGSNLSETDKTVEWSSSAPAIATVSNGLVTAKSKGTATITATSKKDSTKKAACTVTVLEASPQAKVLYNFDYSSLGSYASGTTSSYHSSEAFFDTAVYLYYNKTSGSALRIRNDGSNNTAINYNAENTSTKDGTIGATVTGTSDFYCGIDLSKLSISSPDKVTVSFKVETFGSSNNKATDTGIVYLVDVATNKSVAVLTEFPLKSSGGPYTLSAKVSKTANVRIFLSRNGSEAGGIDITEIKVIDESATETVVMPSSITLSKTTASLEITEENLTPTTTITATIVPNNVSTGYDKITWSSSDASVATISNGTITAKKAGTATITATTKNGLSATCTVTVTSTVATNYIRASDAPIGFASVNAASPFGGQGGTVVTVSNKADFKKYAESSSKYVIYVNGMIDLSEGMLPTTAGGSTPALDNFVKNATGLEKGPYTGYNDFKTKYAGACSASTNDKKSDAPTSTYGKDLWTLNKAYSSTVTINVKSDKTIIGVDENSGLKGGRICIAGVNNIAIRNLILQDAYDPFPHHEENDGFNAELDCIVMQKSSDKGNSNIWIDLCTLKDTMHTSNVSTSSSSEKWQTYDGLCDMKDSTDYVTISNCIFYDHDKTMLIGSADDNKSANNGGYRTITIYHNYFLNCGQRLPMVRWTKNHVYNNVYDRNSSAYYASQSTINCRANSLVVAENNFFGSGVRAISDGGGTHSDGPSSSTFDPKDWYSYELQSVSDAKSYVLANAGAGKWTVKK